MKRQIAITLALALLLAMAPVTLAAAQPATRTLVYEMTEAEIDMFIATGTESDGMRMSGSPTVTKTSDGLKLSGRDADWQGIDIKAEVFADGSAYYEIEVIVSAATSVEFQLANTDSPYAALSGCIGTQETITYSDYGMFFHDPQRGLRIKTSEDNNNGTTPCVDFTIQSIMVWLNDSPLAPPSFYPDSNGLVYEMTVNEIDKFLSVGNESAGLRMAGSPTVSKSGTSMKLTNRTADWNAMDIKANVFSYPAAFYYMEVALKSDTELTFKLGQTDSPYGELVAATGTSLTLSYQARGSDFQYPQRGLRIQTEEDGSNGYADFTIESIKIWIMATQQNIKAYYYDSEGWGSVNAYMWEPTEQFGGWGGTPCYYEGNNWWSVSIPEYADGFHIIFNNYSQTAYQTNDLVLKSGRNFFYGERHIPDQGAGLTQAEALAKFGSLPASLTPPPGSSPEPEPSPSPTPSPEPSPSPTPTPSPEPLPALTPGTTLDLSDISPEELDVIISNTISVNEKISEQVNGLINASLAGATNAALVVVDEKTVLLVNEDGTVAAKIKSVSDNAVVITGGDGKVDAIIAPQEPVIVTDEATGKVTATHAVKKADAISAINAAVEEALAAQAAAEEQGKELLTKPVTITIPISASVSKDGVEATVQKTQFPSSVLNAMVDSDITMELTIPSSIGSATFNQEALNSIAGATDGGTVVFTVEAVDMKNFDAPDEIKAIVGNKPVYDFSLTVGGVAVHSFGTGKITVELPYELKPNENPNAIVVFFVDMDGNLTMMRGSYSAESKSVTFVTSHFSLYYIDTAKITIFKDVPDDHPNKDAIDFLSARGIIQGVGDDLYAPDKPIKRIEQLLMIMRAFNIEAEEDAESLDEYRFADAEGKWYDDALATARKLGIVQGMGDNMFYGDEYLTCAQMMLILYNTLEALGELGMLAPDGADVARTLEEFEDADALGWAGAEEFKVKIEAVLWSGIYQEELLNAHVKYDRALMAQLLYNLLTNPA